MKSVADSWIFRRRDLLGIACLVPLAGLILFSRPWSERGSGLAFLTEGLGWAFFGLYVLFRLWATLFVGGRKDRVLQVDGPYSITRNPLYVGSFFLALSCGAFLQSMLFLVGVTLACLLYAHGVVVAEEKMLADLFPNEYPEYLRRTPRFVPRFSLHHAPAKVTVDLAALRREAKRLAGAATIPVIIHGVEYLRSAPWWPHWLPPL